jgi:hypothetical protein
MRHAVVVCGKCGEPQVKFYPFEEEKCSHCGARVTPKEVIIISPTGEQARECVKNYRSEKALMRNNLASLKSLNLKESAVLMNVVTKFRPEETHSSYIRGDNETRKKRR